MHYTQRHNDRSRHILLLRIAHPPKPYNIRLQDSRRVQRHVHLPRLECVHASHVQLALPVFEVHPQHRYELRSLRSSLQIVRLQNPLVRDRCTCSLEKKKRKKGTDEVRTRVVLRTHRIRQITVQQLVFRIQTHRPVLIDVLAVAEADMSADQYIRADSVVLGVGQQRERVRGLCTLVRRRHGLLRGFGRSGRDQVYR